MSESRKHGLLRLRLLDEHTEAVADTMAHERARFQRLASKESAPRVVSSHNLFQTPEPLADRLAGMFETFGRVLEPSAGLGRLYRAVRKRSDCHVTMVEQAAECCGELYRTTEGDENTRLIQGDFLAQTVDCLGLFDVVIMNPPFRMGSDCKHVSHALQFVCTGGRLVSLCANGPKQRAKLKPIATEWLDLPAGSFKSEGTGVETAIVVIQK